MMVRGALLDFKFSKEEALKHLKASIKKIGAPFVFILSSPILEAAYLPRVEDIVEKARGPKALKIA